MPVVIGHDPSWGGYGYCLATRRGPVSVGWVSLKGQKDRLAAFLDFERDTLGPLRAEADLLVAIDGGEGDEQPFEIAEDVLRKHAPKYQGKGGNQAATGFALGEISALIRRGAYRPGWLAPWLVPIPTWRAWHRLKGARLNVKVGAIQTVKYLGYGDLLEPYPDHLHRKRPDTGPKGDVAEAILIAVGAAARPGLHPSRSK